MRRRVFAELGVVLGLIWLGSAPMFLAGAQADDKDKSKEVVCEDRKFLVDGKEKQPLTIRVGESVVWVNKDRVRHTATSDDDSPDKFDEVEISGNDKSKPIKFMKTGTFKYHCDPHPKMQGTIIVKE